MIFDVTVGDVTVGVTDYRVEVERTPTGLVVRIAGEEFRPDVVVTGPDALSILLAGRSLEVTQQQTAAGALITFAGKTFPVEVRDPRSFRSRKKTGASAAGPMKIIAPMPGKVVRILAAAGNEVEAGQPVIVIEAMKMQNELKAPKKGKIQKVLVGEGAAVNAGDALVIVE